MRNPVPVIDLFAGPGGLGEGFSTFKRPDGRPAFELSISIEKEASAFRTLLLRSVQRRLRSTPAYQHYLDYVTGHLTPDEFRAERSVAAAFAEAGLEAKQYELGRTSEGTIDTELRRALSGTSDWVLIGGPPCQAYSLAGRSRRANDAAFAKDVKHFLYREYLRIIHKFKPSIFVMENVKGLLSSTHSGKSMFGRILEDLSTPFDGMEYELLSLVQPDHGLGLAPEDYLIEAERFGIPQSRHRVILLGVRKGLKVNNVGLLEPREAISVADAIHDLPPIRSRISRGGDSAVDWQQAVSDAVQLVRGEVSLELLRAMREAAAACKAHRSVGGPFISDASARGAAFGPRFVPSSHNRRRKLFRDWVLRPEVGGFLQHEARAHMPEDLRRYLYASCFAYRHEYSPRLRDYPDVLLPEHRNVTKAELAPFQDRFRVQCVDQPSTTVVSHIAKDGHYYIHYDASQCRSLTVREAARLQTFPDDYFFEGNRTEQYTQVGNAVPPLLAHQIAEIVYSTLATLQGSSKKELARAA